MQCACGGNAKMNIQETFYVCEACGRTSRKVKGNSLMDLLDEPVSAEEYHSLQPKIAKLRKQKKWAVAHEKDIIKHLTGKS